MANFAALFYDCKAKTSHATIAPPIAPAKKPEREEATARPILKGYWRCSSEIKSLNITLLYQTTSASNNRSSG